MKGKNMLIKTIKELRHALTRQKHEAAFREERLKRDFDDLQKRYQSSVFGYNERVTQVPESTGPFLRQMEAMQVRILIEHCLQLYMNQKEVIDALSLEAKIEPQFTELVWQQLEDQNREFFKAYYLRLRLKNQITAFNKLLENQLQIMNNEFSSGIPSMSPPDPPNGTSSNPYTAPGSAMPHGLMGNGSSSDIMNGTPSGDQLIYSSKEMHGLHSGIDAPSNLQSTQNSAAALFGVDNGAVVKTESGYSTNADFAFGNTFLESCQSIGDASGGSFSSSELNGQPLNDSLLDIESSSFDFLNQIPQNFVFPDLVDDFSQGAEVLENYNKSPFLASETNNFSDSAGGDHTG